MITLVSQENGRVLECAATYSDQRDISFPAMMEVGDGVTGAAVSGREPVAFSARDLEAIEGIGFTPEAGVSVPIIGRASQRSGHAYEESPIGALTVLCAIAGTSWSRTTLRCCVA